MNEKKLNDYDLLKVIATILVVFAHITRMYTGQGIVTPINGSVTLNYITKYIYSFHMPLFVSISGAIYYYLRQEIGKYKDGKKFLLDKAKRLMIPYIFFGILYVAPVMVGFNFTEDNFIKYAIKGIILSANSRHLWYVFMLFNAFVIVYFTEKYVNKMHKLLSIAGIFVIYLMSVKLPNILQIKDTAEYLIYFYLGYLFQANKNILATKLKFNKVTVVLAFMLNVITLYLSLNIQTKWFIINTISLCSAVFGMISVYSIINMLFNTNIFNAKLYKELKRNSFGIYLFHPMIIYIMFYYLGNKNINPFLLTGLVFVITMILSDLFTRFVRNISLGIIIGENKSKKSNNNINLKSA
jgi:fucose 4-O-acetylase-like acetyltransferase